MATLGRIDIDKPRYDQRTYSGRAKHFFIITNPLNLFATGKQLEEAKAVVEKYRRGENLPGLTEDDIWRAKNLYDSAYHPDTKTKMFILGRMSAQVPMNMTITGCMMTFYKTPKEVIFWQWFNQTFNAIVNYTNRSGDQPISEKQLGLSYVLATGGAVGASLTMNRMVKIWLSRCRKYTGKLPPIVGRLVPFVAVAAANCINIPCMRSRELVEGITILDEKGQKLGESKNAAKSAIGQVVFSRITIALSVMLIPPFIMEYLEKKPFMKRMPWLSAPVQVGVVGFLLVFATPLCCALFPQMSSMAVRKLEPEVHEKLMALPTPPQVVYFNKGL